MVRELQKSYFGRNRMKPVFFRKVLVSELALLEKGQKSRSPTGENRKFNRNQLRPRFVFHGIQNCNTQISSGIRGYDVGLGAKP